MRVIGLCQAYNEELFMAPCLSWVIDCVDELIITEGRLTPHGNLSTNSTDRTRKIIENFLLVSNKIKFIETPSIPESVPKTREHFEGYNKNFMLQAASPENGDLICIIDVDEFWHPTKFLDIVDRFRKDEKIMHVPVEEYQFAYNTGLCFNASHDGRFMRYLSGSRFGSTNHFLHPNNVDITRDYGALVKREESGMCHLCWVKHPKIIREKVISFNRPSFTAWYNLVYLGFPFIGELVYGKNTRIAPYFGSGFAEGQHEPLYNFNGNLPRTIQNIVVNWIPYIKEHYEDLIIK